MEALFFAAYTVGSGVQQGLIAWLLREFVPARYGEWVNAALHGLGGALYVLLLVAVARHADEPARAGAEWLLLRVALFDPALNLGRSWLSHREGRRWEPLFGVGSSAWSDRALTAVARALHLNASGLSAALRGGALAAALWLR